MRILQVITSLGIGGAERQLLVLTTELVAQGHEVAVVPLAGPNPLTEAFEASGVEVIPLGGIIGRPDPRLITALRREVRRYRPDVVHSHVAEANVVARLALQGLGVPLVDTAHNVREGGREVTWAYRLSRKRAAATTFVSQAAHDRYVELRMVDPDRARVIGNAIDNRFLDLALRNRPIRSFIFVGRLVPQKRVGSLLEAFAAALVRRPELDLVIVGDGPERDRLEALAAELELGDRCRFVGLALDIAPYLEAADAFLTATELEGQPVSLLEAAAAGLPVGTTAFSSLADTLRLPHGYVAPVDQPAELAQVIERLASQPVAKVTEVATDLRRQARALASPAALTKEWLALYRTVATDRVASVGRVVHVVTRLNVGGPAVQLQAQGEVLDGQVVEQIVLTGQPQAGEGDIRQMLTFSLPVIDLPHLKRDPGLGDVLAIREVYRELRRLRPDVVHTHTSKAGLVGRLAALPLRPRPRLVHTFHATLDQQYSGRSRAFVLSVERLLARFTDRLVFLSDSLASIHAELGIGDQKRYRVVPTQVPDIRRTKVDRTEARHEFGLSADSSVVGYLGRFDPVKRFDRFVEVVRRVHEAGWDVHALVVGSGPLRSVAARELDDLGRAGVVVVHQDWVADPRAMLAACDVLVIPSDSEGLPLVLVEAALQGTPLVATDVGAISDYVRDDETGRLCARNAPALAEATIALLSDPVHALGMAAMAEQRVRRDTNPAVVRGLLVELYDVRSVI